MLSKLAADEIKASAAGQELLAYMAERIESLNSIDGIHTTDPQRCAIQVHGRYEALRILNEIFEPFQFGVQGTNDKAEVTASRAGLVDVL